MGRFLPFLIWFALALYACIDCARTPREAMPGRLAKPLWLLVIIAVPFGLGAVAWIIVKGAQRAEDRQRGGVSSRPAHSRAAASRGARRSGPLAPDDDPRFLAQLEQEARARRRQQKQNSAEDSHRHDDDVFDAGGSDADPRPGTQDGNGTGQRSDRPDEDPAEDPRL